MQRQEARTYAAENVERVGGENTKQGAACPNPSGMRGKESMYL